MNKNAIWEKLEAEFKLYPEDFAGPMTSTSIIDDAQKLLNVKFDNLYVNFVKKYGSVLLPGHIVYGFGSLALMSKHVQNVVEKTKLYRDQNWPEIEDWYIVSDDGSGNPIGINPKGEVWLSGHDAGFEKVKLADDFEEFLYKLYTETLFDE
jgi:hypothetical protein